MLRISSNAASNTIQLQHIHPTTTKNTTTTTTTTTAAATQTVQVQSSIFNSTINDKIIRCCQIDPKSTRILHVTAKNKKKIMLNSKNNAKMPKKITARYIYKKFELILKRCTKAYSSSCSQTIGLLVYL